MTPAERFERFSRTGELRGDLRTRSIRAFGYSMGCGGAEFAIRTVSTAILARLIMPDDFGLFMIVVAVTSFADQFRDLGLSTATIQREHVTHEEVSNLFWINVAAGVVLASIVSLLSPMVAWYFRDTRLIAVTSALSLNFLLGGLIVQPEALLARQMRFGTTSVVRTLALLVSSVLAVFMAQRGFTYWALVWREVTRAVFIVAGMAVACLWWPGLPDRRTDVRGLILFGKNLTLSYFCSTLTASMDRFMLGRSFGAATVALYRQPYQLVVAPIAQFMGPLYQVALPALSVVQSEPERYRRCFLKIVTAVALATMPLNVFLAVYAQELTRLVLGPKWEGAAVFLRIFAVGGILRTVVSTPGFVLVSRGDARTLLQTTVLSGVVTAVCMFVGTWWGAQGVAGGEALSVVAMMWPWVICLRGSPVSADAYLGALGRPAAASCVMGLGLLWFRSLVPISTSLLSLMAGLAVSVPILLMVWSLLPGGRTEIRELTSDVVSGLWRRTAGALG